MYTAAHHHCHKAHRQTRTRTRRYGELTGGLRAATLQDHLFANCIRRPVWAVFRLEFFVSKEKNLFMVIFLPASSSVLTAQKTHRVRAYRVVLNICFGFLLTELSMAGAVSRRFIVFSYICSLRGDSKATRVAGENVVSTCLLRPV